MRRASWMVPLLVLSAHAAMGHEHWIVMTATDGQAAVCLCSGHGFPSSEIRLAERLLVETVAIDPAGVVRPFTPLAGDTAWTASFPCEKPGVWVASFALKRPQEDEPLYRARCLSVVGGTDDPTRYASGKGLEIVPLAPVSDLVPGSSLPVAIHRDGVPIDGRVAVTPEKGAVSFYSTGKARPAEIKLASGGVHLLTASHKGRTFALTFSVAERAP